MEPVVIILATYNGEKYIAKQIESIIKQTYTDWDLLIRDDGSTDSTREIIEEACVNDPRIILLNNDCGNTGSAVGNFNLLAEKALHKGYKYVFFSDQDDVWSEEKLEIQLKLMKEHDVLHANLPCLSHSDLEVVDDGLKTLASSFMSYQGLKNENKSPLNILLVQNYVTGCAMAVNRELLEVAMPFPDNIIMHDWWLAQCAAATGSIVFEKKTLVKYRQHGSNVVGAKGYWSLVNPFTRSLGGKWAQGQAGLFRTIRQSKALQERLMERFNCMQNDFACNLVNTYSSLLEFPNLKRVYILIKYGIRRQNIVMNLAFMLRVLFTSKSL